MDANKTSQNDEQPYISRANLETFLILNHVVLGGTICLFGIISNVVNIIIFILQGLNNTMNISLFAMAVSDLCGLITLEWLNMNLNPFMENSQVPFEPSEIQYLTGGWPHLCFSRITCWLTIFITAERYLCIAMPLKVKQIITPQRTKISVCVIYLVMFLTLVPEYISLYFGEKFNAKKNRTLVGLINTNYRASLEGLVFILYAVFGFVSFFLVILFTCILILKLRERTSWRTKSTFDSNNIENFTNRDKKTMNMVVLISTILIVTFTPATAFHIAVFVVPKFDLVGEYSNVFHATWSFAFVSEAINASVNIFLYYKMSSKYKQTFNNLFARCMKKQCSEPATKR